MNTQGIELLKKTAVQSFWNRYTTEPDVWTDLIAMRESDQETDTYARFGSAPMPEALKGDLEYKAANEYSYSVTNDRYRAGLRIGAKTIKFQQWDEVANLVGNLGAKARSHVQKLATSLIESGFATATEDGQFFFDTDHADPGAEYTTNQDNDKTNAIVDKDAPTELELAASIRTCIDAFYGFKDDRGDPFTVEPIGSENLVVMVPTAYATVARRVAVANQLTGPIGNDLMGQFDVRVNRRLANTDRFFAFVKSSMHKPIIKQQAGGVEFFQEYDKTSGDLFVGAEWWGKLAFGNWRTAVGFIHTTA